MRIAAAFLFSCLILLLASCAVFVKAEVSRFNSLSTSASGGSFIVVPLDNQRGSVEFRTYASSVAARLKANGFYQASDLASADFAVVIDYGVGGSRQITGSVPIYGQTGGGTTSHSGTLSSYGTGGSTYGNYSGSSYTAPTYGIVGSQSYSRTEHDRFFHLKIFDAKKSTDGDLVSVYEGTVRSSGRSATFATVSECLMDALFDNFFVTGTDRVTLNAQRCMR